MGAINFSQIHPRAFAHPYDREATAALEKVPLFPDVLTKAAELGIERRFRSHHMLNSIQVGPRQFASIWRIVHEIAERLGIPAPLTYLTRQGGVNAFAFGRSTHSLVLTSGLVDAMSEREIEGIIAHEMGHMLCQHMLYMGVGLTLTSGALPSLGLTKLLPFVEQALYRAFFAWFRAAEYSADRAAVLILEDPEPLADCLSRLAGVPGRFEREFDRSLFVEQARNLEVEKTPWTRIITFGMDAFLTHPEPAKRVGAILDWSRSEEYKTILRGRYLTKFRVQALERVVIPGVPSCALCRSPVGKAPVCPVCGLDQDPRRQQDCPNEHVNNINWMFCMDCGQPLSQRAAGTGIPDC